MGPASGVDQASLGDTARLDTTNDTDLLEDTSDASRQPVNIHDDPILQLSDAIRVENHPDSLPGVPVTPSLPPASADSARLVHRLSMTRQR